MNYLSKYWTVDYKYLFRIFDKNIRPCNTEPYVYILFVTTSLSMS
jgi:hypothetical protein